MNNRKPVIGVTDSDGGKKLPWLCIKAAIWLAGGIAIRITPGTIIPLNNFHGFIISGGVDINPRLYGEASIAEEKQYDVLRDLLELRIAKIALQKKIPLLGICRGAQIMNIAFNGSLYQEVGHVFDDFLPVNSLIGKIIARRDVYIKNDSYLFRILGNYDRYRVNSLHHQGINQLGKCFCTIAWEENGLIQAIENNQKTPHPFFIGVQWHPELMLHANSSRRLFQELVKKAELYLKQEQTIVTLL